MKAKEVYPVVADISFNKEEKNYIFNYCYKLILLPDSNCQISFNDNKHYKKYPKGICIPIELNTNNCEPITRLYIKGEKEGVLGLWGFR